VAVQFKIYAKCLLGQYDAAKRRISAALRPKRARGVLGQTAGHTRKQPDTAGQRARSKQPLTWEFQQVGSFFVAAGRAGLEPATKGI
jgi:hypothetical protein